MLQNTGLYSLLFTQNLPWQLYKSDSLNRNHSLLYYLKHNSALYPRQRNYSSRSSTHITWPSRFRIARSSAFAEADFPLRCSAVTGCDGRTKGVRSGAVSESVIRSLLNLPSFSSDQIPRDRRILFVWRPKIRSRSLKGLRVAGRLLVQLISRR